MKVRTVSRRGAAAVEFAAVLPLLLLLFVLGADFARVFYYDLTIENCARNGALFLSDPFQAEKSQFEDYKEATLADATSFNPPLTEDDISSVTGTDGDGNPYVTVTVNYRFQSITSFLANYGNMDLSASIQMRVTPLDPDNPSNN